MRIYGVHQKRMDSDLSFPEYIMFANSPHFNGTGYPPTRSKKGKTSSGAG